MDILFWGTIIEKIQSGEHLYVIEEIEGDSPEYRLIITEIFTDELIFMEILSKKDKDMFLYLVDYYIGLEKQGKLFKDFIRKNIMEIR